MFIVLFFKKDEFRPHGDLNSLDLSYHMCFPQSTFLINDSLTSQFPLVVSLSCSRPTYTGNSSRKVHVSSLLTSKSTSYRSSCGNDQGKDSISVFLTLLNLVCDTSVIVTLKWQTQGLSTFRRVERIQTRFKS